MKAYNCYIPMVDDTGDLNGRCAYCGEENSSNAKGQVMKTANPNENNNVQCTNCMEWEYFEGYGYGCFVMETMAPLDAEKCDFFALRDEYKKKTHELHIAK